MMRNVARLTGLALLFTARLVASTLRVPADYETVAAAVSMASDGDVILVAPGEYVVRAPIRFGGKAITLKGEGGASQTVLKMSGEPDNPLVASVVAFDEAEGESTVLEGFTITGGKGGPWWPEAPESMVGGGVACVGPVRPKIVRCVVRGNSAERGGGTILLSEAAPTWIECEISGNYGSAIGGGCACGSSAAVFLRCLVKGNVTGPDAKFGQGGGIWCGIGAETVFESCEVTENWAFGIAGGGGIHVQNHARPVFSDCLIWRNGSDSGGGVFAYVSPTATFRRCSILSNMASQGGGGAVSCLRCQSTEGSLTFSECLLCGNSAYWGGAVRCFDSIVSFVNSPIVGNVAQKAGGALWSASTAQVNLLQCTISGNLAREEGGGGLYCDGEPLQPARLTSTIVWGNQPDSCCGEEIACLTDQDPRFSRAGIYDFKRFATIEVSGRPKLIPDFIVDAGDYGLAPDSPAIDQGDAASCPDTDYLGNPRPCGPKPDIGAYEFIARSCLPPSPFVRGDADSSSQANLSDAIAVLNYLFRSAEMACLKAADTNDDGEVNITDAVYLLGYLFLGRDPPPPPLDECGSDPTRDGLSCDSFARCGP